MLSTIWPYVCLLFSLSALGVSLLAMQFALTNKRHDGDFRRLLLIITQMEDDHAALLASHKRLRSRVGMRELRAKRKVSEDVPGDLDVDDQPAANDDDIAAWKRKMRLKLHKGDIKP